MKPSNVFLLAITFVLFTLTSKAQISGTTFRDINGDGIRQISAPNEPVLGGITVQVYNSTNTLVGTATSSAAGTYSITPTGAAPFRVEFTIPAALSVYQESSGGAGYGSSIQFIATSTQAGVNFAVMNPEDFSSTQIPRLAIPQHIPGDALLGGTAGTASSLKSMLYNSSATTLNSLQNNATASQVGAVWGLGWDKLSAKLFSAAFVRRHSGLGPLGAGGIYVTNFASGTGVTTNLIDLATVPGVNLGAVPTNAARGLLASSTAFTDRDDLVFGLIGKVGLGDLDIDLNTKKVYVVNLFERNVIVIDIANYLSTGTLPTAANVSELAITGMPVATNGVARPFALKIYRDKLYIGITNTAELDAAAAAATNMSMTVVSLDLITNIWATPVAASTLNYTHGEPQVGGGNVNHPWSDATDVNAARVNGNGWITSPASYGPGNVYFASRTSPWLTDIEFDLDGSMVLSTSDRAGFQWGGFHPHPNAGTPLPDLIDFRTGGDIIRFYNNSGTFVREVNGTTLVGGGCGLASGQAEFYCGENFNGNSGHAENSGGALAFLPGSDEMTQTAMDPNANIWANGVQKLSNTTGQKSGTSFELYGGGNVGAASFGKSNGVGDIELLLDVAPLQVGNRIWKDANGNGLQDANENGMAGLTVSFVSPGLDGDYATAGDNQIWTTTTDANGNYYFSKANMVANDNRKPAGWGGFTNGILPGYDYRVETTIPTGSVLTVTDATGNTQDRIDNDGTQAGSIIRIPVNVTQTNNTLDIGFVYATLGNKVWRDDNTDGLQDANEPGFASISVSLYTNGLDNLPNTADDILADATVTDALGNYLFEDLAPGDYNIRITPPANYKFTTQGGAADAGTATDSDVDAFGISKTITLTGGEMELNADAGLVLSTTVLTSSIGDKVWYDTNGDGVQDANEPGVSGVTVTLYDGAGNIAPVSKTDANGNYLFTNLPNGTYQVGVSAPGGTVLTTSTGTTPANNTDSDIDPVTGKSATITISAAGTVITGIDAGLKNDTKAALGDFVWNDINRDGIQQATEQGIPNVVMQLYAAGPDNAVGGGDDILIVTATTDALGYYMFPNLDPAKYFVVATPPAGYVVTLPNVVAGNPALDIKDNDFTAGAAPYTGKYVSGIYDLPNTVGKVPRDMTVDLGLYRNVAINTLNSISNFVWRDNNEDGVQTAGEIGVANVTVRLLDGAGAPFNNPSTGQPYIQVTDANGLYQFIDLPDGNYIVEFTNIPVGYNLTGANTAPGVANNDATDSDTDPVTGRTGINALDPTSVTATSVNNTSIDAGIKTRPAGTASLGDRVWYDFGSGTPANNSNGKQDAGESGVQGIKVELLDASSNPVNIPGGAVPFIVTTNSLGEYMFTNLPAGIYKVRFSNFPIGYTASPANAVANNTTTDADATFGGAAIATTTATTPNYSLATGEVNPTVDMGIAPPTGRNSVGNYVWIDANNDGLQGTAVLEPGITGINVKLYNNGVDGLPGTSDDVFAGVTTTDADGLYMFNGLVDGNYNIVFKNLPAGYSITAKEAVITGTTGSDADLTTGRTATIALDPTSISATSIILTYVDAGIKTSRAILGDYVWLDANANGIQDAGEPPISGVTVTLYDNTNTPIATAITDKNGKYLFTNLLAGTYTVGFTNYPSSLEFTTKEATPTATGSDVNPATGLTDNIILTAGQVNLTVDAGLKPKNPASVGDYVWIDVDRNGVQGITEPGLPGILATLYDAANNKVGSAVTDGNGLYRITNITPATGYYIIFSNLSVGTAFTTQTSNVTTTDATLGSDANVIGVVGQTASFPLTAGQYLPHVDAGVRYDAFYARLGNRVWKDDNKDGLQTAGEPGVAGINVQLYRNGTDQIANTADDVFVGSTVTDAYGYYIFETLDSTVTTNATTIAQTSYNVKFTLPANYVFTTAVTPGDNANNTNSDANIFTGRTVGYILNPNESDTTVDAGIVFADAITQNIGDYVWLDNNHNGIQDAAEPGVSGIVVTLFNSANTPVATTLTDTRGKYVFQAVPVGAGYTVGFSLPAGLSFTDNDMGGDDAKDSDVDPVGTSPTFGKTPAFNVIAGVDNYTLDAGLHNATTGNASLGDKVWNDLNKNGLQDANEYGVEGVTVDLMDATGTTILRTLKTDAFGNYMFTDLVPGIYVVRFVLPAGFSRSPQNVGTNDGIDNDAAVADGKTGPITLVADERNTTVDAGINKTASTATTPRLGDRVWFDINNNGIQDAAEQGVPGITAVLYTSVNVAVDTTTTNTTGNYLFPDLAANTYYVIFKNIPPGYTFTTRVSSADNQNNTNSDADSLGKTINVALAAAETDLTVDAGIITGAPSGKGSLGDRVWYDMNNNNIQDAGETGVNGVLVYLSKDVNRDGAFTAGATEQLWDTTYTNANGEYLFTGLDSGYYQVRFLIPTGYTSITQDAGSNDNLDSDGPVTAAGGTSVTATYTLAQGEENLTIDLGIRKTVVTNASLGNQVWLDADKDGIKDANETAVPGVQATLYNATTNAVIATTTTDKDGYYLFDNLAPATYVVRFTNFPPGMSSTTQTAAITNDKSAADSLTGYTPIITLVASQNRTDVDFGLQTVRAALGDYVWIDGNENGVQDATEKPVPGVTTTLYAADGTSVISSMITDANGKYYYPNLAPGSYVVGFSTTPVGYNFTQQIASADNGNNTNSDADATTGKTMQVLLDPSEIDLTIDAGLFRPTASIGNFVWYDTTYNGIQNAGEPGAAGVIATLYNSANQPIGSSVTDGNGYWLITNVPAGTGYYVGFTNIPNGYGPTIKDATGAGTGGVTDSDTDSDVNTAAITGAFDVTPNTNNVKIDAGIIIGAPLPVKLVSFTAVPQGEKVVLQWQVAEQLNITSYTIEYSTNGVTFTALETVAANSYTAAVYNAMHLTPVKGANFYRLKVNEPADKHSYSSIRMVRFTDAGNISVYPNPFTAEIGISVTSLSTQTATYTITDTKGRIIQQNKTTLNKGAN